ncbi:MAG: hypothetical protein ACRD5G_16855, partial [Candidatus Acidiferrales bacterium]
MSLLKRMIHRLHRKLLLQHRTPAAVSALALSLALLALAERPARGAQQPPPSLMEQTWAEADRKSAGCITCHIATDEPTMHSGGTVRLGCTDCHGGNADVKAGGAGAMGPDAYEQAKQRAHPQPRVPQLWRTAANPVRAFAEWLEEDAEYIAFVNPGDLRVAPRTCGSAGCHLQEVQNVRSSMMT